MSQRSVRLARQDVEPERGSLWGRFISRQLERKGKKTVRWLANQLALRDPHGSHLENTLGKRISGAALPPGLDEQGLIADILGLSRRARAEMAAAAAADVCVKALAKWWPALTERQLDILARALQAIGALLFEMTGNLRAILYLPFIMRQLEPFQTHAGVLAVTQNKAAHIRIPPPFHPPAYGPIEPISVPWSRHHGFLESATVRKIQDGILNPADVLNALRNQFDFCAEGKDELFVLESGEMYYHLVQDLPAILFRCPAAEPVYAMTDGIACSLSSQVHGSPHIGPVKEFVLVVDTQCGYDVSYHYLSEVYCVSGQTIKRGDVIGKSGSAAAVDKSGTVSSGIAITCSISRQLFPESDWTPDQFIDPSILCPYTSTKELSVPMDHIATSERQMLHTEEILSSFTLADLLEPHSGRGVFWMPRYLDEPYLLVSNNKILAELQMATVYAAILALYTWQRIRRRR